MAAIWDALIYSEKSCLPKAKPSKIKTLDSRLRGNDNFFSVSFADLIGLVCRLEYMRKPLNPYSCQLTRCAASLGLQAGEG
jgi:hypothetical protein